MQIICDRIDVIITFSILGRLKTVDFLIENGADVNVKDNNGETPLMAASAFSNCRVIKLLIEKGADVNAKDNGGWSALIYAAYNGKFCFHITVNIKISTEYVFTGRDVSVSLLLRNGADADYALKYATESNSRLMTANFYNIDSIYMGRDTSGSSSYQKAIDTINAKNTFWQRFQSYFDCIL